MRFREFIFALLVVTASFPAQAQTTIAAIVNDDVISDLDLEQRVKFIGATTSLDVRKPDVRRQILKQLIDEKLKRQEAARAGVTVTDADLKRAVDATLLQNGTDADKMKALLKKHGLPYAIVEDQIKSDLLFIKALRRMSGQRAEVSDAEVETKRAEIENKVSENQYLLSEIFLPVSEKDKDGAVYGRAIQIIMKIREGVPFEKLAEEYSKAPSAENGGLLGWVPESAVVPEMKEELAQMEVGQVSSPIRTENGYTVIALRALRSPEDMKEQDAFRMAQIFLPAGSAKERTKILKRIDATAGSCTQFMSLAEQLKTTPRADLGKVPVSDIPSPILDRVKDIGLMQPSEPLGIDGGELVFMVCAREKVSPVPSKEELKMQIESQRLEMMARRRLRELRRSAITEIR